jgi:hypothetical protein
MQRRHHPDLRGDAHVAAFTLPRKIDAITGAARQRCRGHIAGIGVGQVMLRGFQPLNPPTFASTGTWQFLRRDDGAIAPDDVLGLQAEFGFESITVRIIFKIAVTITIFTVVILPQETLVMAHPREQRDALLVLRRIADAITATVNETPPGAPGGVMYAAVMQHLSLDQFEAIMRVLVEAGRLTKRGDCYYPC